MKKKLAIGVIIMGTIVLAVKGNEKRKLVGAAQTSRVEMNNALLNHESLVAAENTGLHDIGTVQKDAFFELPTVNSIMDQYRTFSESELRAEIVRISQIAEGRNLYEKANSGEISKIERKDLAQIIRINTALHHLLIDRELEEN